MIEQENKKSFGTLIREHKIYSTLSFITIILSLYFSYLDFINLSAIIGLSINIGIIAVFWFVIAFKKPPKKKIGATFTIATCTIIFVLMLANYYLQVFLLERRMVPLINAISEHHKTTNTYPEKISFLVPNFIDHIPSCKGAPKSPLYYQKNEQFVLACVTFGFLKHTYESQNNEWISWD